MERLKLEGKTGELATIESTEEIMELKWWKYYRDLYHIFSCGVEMGYMSACEET